MNLSPKEQVLTFYLWAGREFGWTAKAIDEMDLSLFLDYYCLYDKQNNPDEYLPGEFFFKP